jgi:hypothetical protein
MKAEAAAELIGTSTGFLRRLAREGFISRPCTPATVREGYAAYMADKEARAAEREAERETSIAHDIERERLRLADLRHQLATHRRAKAEHVAEAWAWTFGEVRADLSAIWSKACDRIPGRAEWCEARDHIERRLEMLPVLFDYSHHLRPTPGRAPQGSKRVGALARSHIPGRSNGGHDARRCGGRRRTRPKVSRFPQ